MDLAKAWLSHRGAHFSATYTGVLTLLPGAEGEYRAACADGSAFGVTFASPIAANDMLSDIDQPLLLLLEKLSLPDLVTERGWSVVGTAPRAR